MNQINIFSHILFYRNKVKIKEIIKAIVFFYHTTTIRSLYLLSKRAKDLIKTQVSVFCIFSQVKLPDNIQPIKGDNTSLNFRKMVF